jgi:RNA polymerase sigma factor (sigma-70 family)
VVRVTTNLAIDRLRKRARADRRRADTHRGDHAPDPGDTRRIDLERALRRLSARQREVVVLRYLAGLPEAEVAALLGCSPGTVKQHASRGLAGLRKTLGEVAGA